MRRLDPPFTIAGITLYDAEQRLLVVLWQAHQLGIVPNFAAPQYAAYLLTASRFRREHPEVMYRAIDGGYCLTRFGEWIGEVLFDAGAYEWGDLIPTTRRATSARKGGG